MQAAGNTNIYVILTVFISLRFFVDTDNEELDFSKDWVYCLSQIYFVQHLIKLLS